MNPRKLSGWPGSIQPPSSPRNSSMLMNVTREQSRSSSVIIRARIRYCPTGPTGTMRQVGRSASLFSRINPAISSAMSRARASALPPMRTWTIVPWPSVARGIVIRRKRSMGCLLLQRCNFRGTAELGVEPAVAEVDRQADHEPDDQANPVVAAEREHQAAVDQDAERRHERQRGGPERPLDLRALGSQDPDRGADDHEGEQGA